MRASLLWLLTLCVPLAVNAGTIGLYSEETCNSCSLTVLAGQSRTFYVRFTGGGGRLPVTGADFKIVGLPSAWSTSVEPNPQCTYLQGDLFSGGALMGFNHPHTEDCFEFYRITVRATTSVQDVLLRVATSDNSFWGANCPLVTYHPPPDPPYLCQTGGLLYINGSGTCTVPVEHTTWGNVKVLYGSDG